MTTPSFTPLVMLIAKCYALEDFQVRASNFLNDKLALLAIKSRPSQNMVVSVLAVKLPLCKLASVADRETKVELMVALGFSKPSMISTCYLDLKQILQISTDVDLVLVDRMYLHVKHDIDPLFLHESLENYGVQIEKAGFDLPMASAAFINRVIGTQTYRRIPVSLDPSDINKNTSMIIVNAAHYKTTWEKRFDVRMTQKVKFRDLHNTFTQVPMMTQIQYHQYYSNEALGFNMVKMLLSSYGTSMTLLVPNSPSGLPTLLNKMEEQPEILQKALSNMTIECVKVQVPKFIIKTSIDLEDLLKEVGIKKIFESSSGLDAILTKNSSMKNVHLNKVKQKIFIEIDEFGVYFPRNKDDLDRFDDYPEVESLPGEKFKSLIADRPFLFSINIHGGKNTRTHSGTDDISDQLFTGIYYGPLSSPV